MKYPIYETSFKGNWIIQNVNGPVSGDTLYLRTDSRSNILRLNYSTAALGSGVVEVIYKYETEQFFYDD